MSDAGRQPMTYYDELHLLPSASAEQIRQAYRNLARMLHPDRQQDPPLRSLAECQMKRLNEIASILLDPDRRRQYDERLRDRHAVTALLSVPQVRRISPRFPAHTLAWLAAAALSALCLVLSITGIQTAPSQYAQPGQRPDVSLPLKGVKTGTAKTAALTGARDRRALLPPAESNATENKAGEPQWNPPPLAIEVPFTRPEVNFSIPDLPPPPA